MKIGRVLIAAVIGFAAPAVASAATLDMTLTADNQFSVYLSSDDATLGTLLGSSSVWQSPVTISTDLTGPIEYIHIVATNWTDDTGYPQYGVGTPYGTGNNPDALLGQFSVSGGYVFGNGQTTLLTGPAGILAVQATDSTTWTTPTLAPVVDAQNGSGIWGGPLPGISSSAYWIWSNPDDGDYADFSIAIVDPTPLPATLPLFAGGLGLLGYVAGRRKRNVAAVSAMA